MNNYTYAICNVADDLSKIDFNKILTTSADTARRSIDGTLIIIKYMSEPDFITDKTITPSKTLNHADALTEMAKDAWSKDPDV